MKKIYFVLILAFVFSTMISAADNHYTITDEEYGVEVHVTHLNYEMMQLIKEKYSTNYKLEMPIDGPVEELKWLEEYKYKEVDLEVFWNDYNKDVSFMLVTTSRDTTNYEKNYKLSYETITNVVTGKTYKNFITLEPLDNTLGGFIGFRWGYYIPPAARFHFVMVLPKMEEAIIKHSDSTQLISFVDDPQKKDNAVKSYIEHLKQNISYAEQMLSD